MAIDPISSTSPTIDRGPTSAAAAAAAGNVADRAADTADAAIAATQRAATDLLSGASDKVRSLRQKASPAIDRVVAPFDAASAYTQQAPLKSLLIAAAAGAAAMALISLLSR